MRKARSETFDVPGGSFATDFDMTSVTIRNIGRGSVESICGRSVNPGVRHCVTERLHSKRKPGAVGGRVRDIDDCDGNHSAQRDCPVRARRKGGNASSGGVAAACPGSWAPVRSGLGVRRSQVIDSGGVTHAGVDLANFVPLFVRRAGGNGLPVPPGCRPVTFPPANHEQGMRTGCDLPNRAVRSRSISRAGALVGEERIGSPT